MIYLYNIEIVQDGGPAHLEFEKEDHKGRALAVNFVPPGDCYEILFVDIEGGQTAWEQFSGKVSDWALVRYVHNVGNKFYDLFIDSPIPL